MTKVYRKRKGEKVMQKRILKKIAVIVLTQGMAISAYAVAPGFYMGVMAGPATNSGGTQQAQMQTPTTTTTPVTPKSTQFGSRLLMGYKINKYAGFEGGLTYISGVNYDNKGVNTCSSTNVRVRDFDFVGKGQIPMGNSFDVFGKAGAAIVYQSTSGALNPRLNQDCGNTQYTNKVAPTVSVGASYDLNQNWVADASWNRIMLGGPLSNVDFYALGISYHFVDVYCGQFLC